jgi:serine/threonine protein kinase
LHTLHPPVIHRDINPKNLLLSQTNEVYLVDFGAVQEKIRTTFLVIMLPEPRCYICSLTDTLRIFRPSSTNRIFRSLSGFQRELLNGLLEFDVSKRIASPDAVRKILDNSFTPSPPPKVANRVFDPKAYA